MDVLELITEDYSLLVVTDNPYPLYKRASGRITDITSSTSYNFSSHYKKFTRIKIEDNSAERTTILPDAPAPPLFFENKDYLIEIEFNDSVEDPIVLSRSKNEYYNFIDRKRRGYQVLTRNINFQNDIGQCELNIRYSKNGKVREDKLHFEVFPTKLDYKRDYNQILRDIHREYAYLVLEYLKKTYSSFKTSGTSTNNIIWWQVFGELYKEIIKSVRLILHKPHNRLVRRKTYKKADRIKKLTPALEEEIARYRHIPSRYYPIQEKVNSVDTVENRFVKHVLRDLLKTFNDIRLNLIDTFGTELTDEFKNKLTHISSTFSELLYKPFFRKVGDFSGFRQESLVMQNKAGYASLYRNWVILKKGIDFYNGIRKIELKNIAELYQIWCFIGIKNMIGEIVDKQPDDVELAKTILEKFNIIIKKGDESRITFEGENREKIELIHEYSVSSGSNKAVTSYTVRQQPDIVLRINKSDLKEDYTFTYLFDAKYRLENQTQGVDYPPSDSINQMHRYRDAIYYKEQSVQRKGKEIIGGYVLYPGTGSYEELTDSPYINSIEEVNIGAFPLRPNDAENASLLLKDHLKRIIESNSENILKDVIPQKKYQYEEFNPHVLVGIVSKKKQLQYLYDTPNPIYHTPMFPRRFGSDKLKYLAPYAEKLGISCYFEIIDYEVIPRHKIFPRNHPLYEPSKQDYLVLNLGKKYELPEVYKIQGGTIRNFRYTNLYNLRNPINGKLKME